MRRIRRGGLAALAGFALVAAAACGDDGGSSGGGGSLGSLGEAIETIPLEVLEEGATIVWADLDAATEVAGLERPEAGDLDALRDWAMALTASTDSPVAVPLADTLQQVSLMRVDEFEEELGWSIFDVDAFVELYHPPTRFFVGSGDLGVDGEGVTELGDGIHTAGEGDDQSTYLEERTTARPLGRPLRLAEADGLLAASLRTAPLERWLDGEGERLDDHAGIDAVADAIDDAGAVSAFVVVSSVDTAWAYDVVGVGWSVDDGEAAFTIAFHLTGDDEDGASAALEEALTEGTNLQGRPISDLLALEDLTVDDGVLVATLSPGPDGHAQTPLQALMAQDAPFQAPPRR